MCGAIDMSDVACYTEGMEDNSYIIEALTDASLDKEIVFAEAFGDDIDPSAKAWRLSLLDERAARSRS